LLWGGVQLFFISKMWNLAIFDENSRFRVENSMCVAIVTCLNYFVIVSVLFDKPNTIRVGIQYCFSPEGRNLFAAAQQQHKSINPLDLITVLNFRGGKKFRDHGGTTPYNGA